MNMKKEYRAELRQLAKVERKITGDYNRHHLSVAHQIKQLEKSLSRALKATNREHGRIIYRRGILQARLNS